MLKDLSSAKTALLQNLSSSVGGLLDKMESSYKALDKNMNYSNLICMGIVDFDFDVSDVNKGADFLKSKILKEYNTIFSDIDFNDDSYNNWLINKSTFDLSLDAQRADIVDFKKNYELFIQQFYQSQISLIDSKWKEMDAYISWHVLSLKELTSRRGTLVDVKVKYAALKFKESNYLQYFGTVLWLDVVHDNLLKKIHEDVSRHFNQKIVWYLGKYAQFTDLEDKLMDEAVVLLDRVEVELRRYLDDLVRFYDGDQYQILEKYMSSIQKLYYEDTTNHACNNIIGDWDQPMLQTVLALIADLDSSLSLWYAHYKITSWSVSSSDTFSSKLDDEYKRIVKDIIVKFDTRSQSLIDALIIQTTQDRAAFKDLLRSKINDFDTASAKNQQNMIANFASKARAIAKSAVDQKLLYDTQVFLYTLWEIVYLDVFGFADKQSIGVDQYVPLMYQDYLSEAHLVSKVILPQRFVARSTYQASKIEAKLLLMKQASADKLAFDKLLLDAISKAKLLLLNDSVNMNKKATVNEVLKAMKNIVKK